ncbi:hypothetical protein OF83DRAFT_1168012 [Amylostereum chailletii]|nr:hypothetical protein OF83DRAFT_1168012 [Amylostereum chailletii]
MIADDDVRTTLGALLVGGLIAVSVSGAVAVQTYLYFRMYLNDLLRIKAMVLSIWLLDAMHSCLISYSLWFYLVLNYGDARIADFIPASLALTVAITAIVTFVAHLFFSFRVFRLSQGNWYLFGPLCLLSLARLVAALVTTVKMANLHSFPAFLAEFMSLFTLGLSLSSVLDIMIAVSMCYYLHISRTGFGSIDHLIDIVMLYIFQNGALPCVVTVATMTCWLTMSNNLIFMGIYFGISKVYALSLLVSLNSRASLKRRSISSSQMDNNADDRPVLFRHLRGSTAQTIRMDSFPFTKTSPPPDSDPKMASQIEVNITKTIEYGLDMDGMQKGKQTSDAGPSNVG